MAQRPQDPTPIHWMSISELTAAYRSKARTPTEVVEALFQRIEATEPLLHSFVLLTKQLALEQAAVVMFLLTPCPNFLTRRHRSNAQNL